jgi:hypothetical protein
LQVAKQEHYYNFFYNPTYHEPKPAKILMWMVASVATPQKMEKGNPNP